MLAAFHARLEARDPARGRWRAYRIEAGTDLLGDWLVDVTYGRIGTQGRRIRHVATGEADAKKMGFYAYPRENPHSRRWPKTPSNPMRATHWFCLSAEPVISDGRKL